MISQQHIETDMMYSHRQLPRWSAVSCDIWCSLVSNEPWRV